MLNFVKWFQPHTIDFGVKHQKLFGLAAWIRFGIATHFIRLWVAGPLWRTILSGGRTSTRLIDGFLLFFPFWAKNIDDYNDGLDVWHIHCTILKFLLKRSENAMVWWQVLFVVCAQNFISLSIIRSPTVILCPVQVSWTVVSQSLIKLTNSYVVFASSLTYCHPWKSGFADNDFNYSRRAVFVKDQIRRLFSL